MKNLFCLVQERFFTDKYRLNKTDQNCVNGGKNVFCIFEAGRCSTLFDFTGNIIRGMDYMTYPYKFQAGSETK
jgi:hypothetical protein